MYNMKNISKTSEKRARLLPVVYYPVGIKTNESMVRP